MVLQCCILQFSSLQCDHTTNQSTKFVMSDQLTEILPKDLAQLRTMYTPDGSKNYTSFTAVDTYIRWFEQDPNVKHIKFFSLNDDFSDGTFVVTDRCDAYADTFNKSSDRLFRLLQLLDYSKGFTFRSIRFELLPVIRTALERVNVNVERVTDLLLHRLRKEEALKLDVQPPKGIELRPITESHDLEKVNSAWPNYNQNSLPFIQRMARYNSSVGAFTEDGTLVAWALRFPTGFIAALQTDDKFYGKGYGGLVLRCLTKKIAELGHDVFGGVLKDNAASLSLFRKHGFEILEVFHLIHTEIKWNSKDE